MLILNLQAENIKKLTAIDITPSDNMVFVTGPNGAGKSSILDCIVMALCGGKAIPAIPIKKGADKGKIVIDVGDFTITRSFTGSNSYLKIENKDGSNVTSPQKFLDKIVGNISFDPLDFLNNEKLKQRNILLQLLGINVDDLDKREKALRDERTIVGRDVGKLKAVYQSDPYYPEMKSTKEVSVSDLSSKLQSAISKNNSHTQEMAANEQIKAMAMKDKERIDAIEIEIQKLTTEKDKLSTSIQARKEEYVSTKATLSNFTILDTEAIQQEIAQVEDTNQKIRANVKKQTAKISLDQAESQYETLTKQIEGIATERTSLLSNATMPVAGLSFDDGGLLYNSIPLDQASDGEKLMVSLGISMALNPTLRVLRIKDGSLLDQNNRSIIAKMVAEKDYQLWFESVGSDGKVGILIEEGEIVSVDGQAVSPKPKAKAKPVDVKPDEAAPTPPPPSKEPIGDEGW